MEELVRRIEEKINELYEVQERQRQDILKLEELKQRIEYYIENPNTIDDDTIDEVKDILELEENDSIIQLRGLFYGVTEPQIIEAIGHLNEIATTRINKINEDIAVIEGNDVFTLINEHNRIIELLDGYNSEVYISSDDLRKLREILGDSEELLRLFYEIAINNSEIERIRRERREQQPEESISIEETLDEQTEQQLDSRDELYTSQQELETAAGLRKEYLDRINTFIENENYKNIEGYEYSLLIINKAKKVLLDSSSEIDFAFINDIGIENPSWYLGNELVVGTAKLLLDAYDNENVHLIKNILNEYKKNKFIDTKDYLKLEGLDSYATLLTTLEEKYKFNEINTVNSYNGMEDKEDADAETRLGIIYKDIISLLKRIDTTTDTRVQLTEEDRAELAKYVKKINEILGNNKDVEISSSEIEEYYGPRDNYIVFYDVDEFQKSLEETIADHSGQRDEIKKNVDSQLQMLKNIDISELISSRKSGNIHTDKGKDNVYEILELKTTNYIRISFKRLNNAKIIDKNGKEHNVIVVIHTCYGKIGKNGKYENLTKGIKIFEDIEKETKRKKKKSRYSNLVEIFSEEKNIDGISEEAREEIEKGIAKLKEYSIDAMQEEIEELTAEDLVEENNEEVNSNDNNIGLGGNNNGQK